MVHLKRQHRSTSMQQSSAAHRTMATKDSTLNGPHIVITLPPQFDQDSVANQLSEACCGLLQGNKQPVFFEEVNANIVALIPVPKDCIERVQYKSFILDRRTQERFQCQFQDPTKNGESNASDNHISLAFAGAVFAWLKANHEVRERLASYDPLIRVVWQPCTGAEKCFLHLHISQNSDSTLLSEVNSLRDWINQKASTVIVRNLPIYVPPRNRFGLSNDQQFRDIAYNHGVSLWTRTMKDSPLGYEWCTLATNDAGQMEAVLSEYTEFSQSAKWSSKNPLSPSLVSPSTSPIKEREIPSSSSSSSHSPVLGSPIHTAVEFAPSMTTAVAPPAFSIPLNPFVFNNYQFPSGLRDSYSSYLTASSGTIPDEEADALDFTNQDFIKRSQMAWSLTQLTSTPEPRN